MRKTTIHFLALVTASIFQTLSLPVLAAGGGALYQGTATCICPESEATDLRKFGTGDYIPGHCKTCEIRASITPPTKDVGDPAAVWVGLANRDALYLMGPDGVWFEAATSTMNNWQETPYDSLPAGMPRTWNFSMTFDMSDLPCSRHDRKLNFVIGYGAIDNARQQRIFEIQKINPAFDIGHLAMAYIREDIMRDEKYGEIFRFCNSGND